MDKTKLMSRFTPKKITLYSLLFLGIIIFCIIIWQIFLYITPQARVDFAVYRPTKLPSGYTIKDTSIDIWSSQLWVPGGIVSIDSPFPYLVDFAQDLNKEGWSVSQEKNKDFSYTCPANNSFNTCRVQSSKAGQQYTLTIYTYSPPDKTAEEYASFVRGGTQITIRAHTDTDHLVSAADWSDTIDSFVPTSTAGVSAHYYHPGP